MLLTPVMNVRARGGGPHFWLRRDTKTRAEPLNSWPTRRAAQPQTVSNQENECEGREVGGRGRGRVPGGGLRGPAGVPQEEGESAGGDGPGRQVRRKPGLLCVYGSCFSALSWTEVV